MLRKEQKKTLRCGNQLIEVSKPLVMGIINATPDSFYEQGRTNRSVEKAVEMAKMVSSLARVRLVLILNLDSKTLLLLL